MQTKSNIQLIQEALKIRESFKASIENLMDKYLIEDSVFVWKSGSLFENTKGYFEVAGEYDSIDEALKVWNPMMSMRVIANKKYQVGQVKTYITECKEDAQVFDINTLVEVR